METYPGELLVGVFPLVFCVDATLDKANEAGGTESSGASDSQQQQPRSQFDRFLDAMAASMLDDPEEYLSNFSRDHTPPSKDGMGSLFRGEEDDDSEAEDELILGSSAGRTTSPGTPFGTTGSSDSNPRSAGRPRGSFGNIGLRLSRSGSKSFSSPSNDNVSPNDFPHHGLNTSYTKVVQAGQGFFQRARIISISTRHGFPPSKDPNGEFNRVQEFMQGKTLSVEKVLSSTRVRPIDGILPSGWLEKHAHALPSVLLVVIQLSQDQRQFSQDELLVKTLQNLQVSLAGKRHCTIQVVALVQDGVSQILAEQWSQTIAGKLQVRDLTLLMVSDLSQDAAPSIGLKNLHKRVRDASLQYYSALTKHAKQKLAKLGAVRTSPLLLPLSIRYCFKLAMLYEFQWKQQKSMKFMVEAYRHVEMYFRYLLQKRSLEEIDKSDPQQDGNIQEGNLNPVKSETGSNYSATVTDETGDFSEGVEFAVQGKYSEGDEDEMLLLNAAKAPEDMVNQCRALADWLNFRILQSGFTSHTEGGLLAASTQWRKHLQVFCSPRRSFVCDPDRAWLDWSFLAHQRLVASQLLERNPPNALGGLGNDFDEVLLRCSPWRSYEAAAEAILRLGSEVQKSANLVVGGGTKKIIDEFRTRYVGGLDNDGYTPKLQEEVKNNHREKALDCIMRAISLYEREVEESKKDEFQLFPWNRSGARLYYLAGSALLGLERHAEATRYLEKAAELCKGWNGLELVIRKMLIECYEKHMPVETDESSQTLASMLLDSYFNAEMSNLDLRRALEKFSILSGGGTIKWYRDCFNEADETLPFSFTLTFPSGTHATAGDGVQASFLIKSNLDYAVHVNSVTLLSMAGQIPIPSMDLLSAKNANEGSDGGIIIQANSEILLSTQIKLPKDLNQIAIDETGNGGEKEGIAGKGSFSKSAKPRTAGYTAAAGARLLPEQEREDSMSRAGWNLRCLGGKTLRCDGLRVVFYPVYSASLSEGKNTEIELTIEKKQKKTETNIKRTPFEEDNYIASAWMRPKHLPMSRGPRCLRVLPPMPDMSVTNLTEPCTNGKVLEGTVNRVLLKLQAGPREICSDVKFKVFCSSLLITSEGRTRKIAEEDPTGSAKDPIASLRDPRVRTPVLVLKDDAATAEMTEYGYEIPAGWVLDGDGRNGRDQYTPIAETIKHGETTYAYFDVYRPSPHITEMEGIVNEDEDAENLSYDRDVCQTDIDVSICYRQSRPTQKIKQIPTRRRGRRKPGEESATTGGGKEEPDLVYLTHSVAILWSAPISAVFSPGLKESQPSGNRHPSNNVPDFNSCALSLTAATKREMVLIDGERVSTKCTLEAEASADGLTAVIEEIRFEDNKDEQAACRFKLLSGIDDNGLLYKADANDPCRKLNLGSKFSLAWTAQVNLTSSYMKGSVSTSLGVISVDWLPSSLDLPEEVATAGKTDLASGHGPLRLAAVPCCRFMGPPCYIENAPFETSIQKMPSYLRVAVPFDVTYYIKNKTTRDQKLKVLLDDAAPSDESHGFLISGFINGEISVGPLETYSLSYTALATRTGKIPMPPVCVSSDRFKTWVIHEASSVRRSLFVLP